MAFLFIIGLSFTSGLCGNWSMMLGMYHSITSTSTRYLYFFFTGPKLVSSEHSSLAGTIMSFSLSCGLLFGSAISFILLYTTTDSTIV